MAIWRFQVSIRPELSDATGRRLWQLLRDFGIHSVEDVRSGRVFLIDLPNVDGDDEVVARRIAEALLSDPVVETYSIHREGQLIVDPGNELAIEVHLKPGVMDHVAQSTVLALADLGIQAAGVRTARRYELRPIPQDRDLPRISRLIGNASIEDVYVGTPPIKAPPTAPRYEFSLVNVAIRNLDGAALDRLSRDGHLFLSSAEMRAIQTYFQSVERDPTNLELETLAQTWSEHCVHKTLKSPYQYRGAPFPAWSFARPVADERDRSASVTYEYENLLRDTIARATRELNADGRGPTCLSVFVDNAGVIAFDETYGIAFKVETHNHPSAIEPYGGASTGIGGVIRDVLGCGLGAKPVANTDVFCAAPPDWPIDRVPKGIIHPKSSLRGIVAGVRDYGNRMGIPTVNGAVHFDPRYLGNPLVYCGCVGLIRRDRIEKSARPGDAIVLIGGRTGRDGIHGATFSSAEMTDTHEDEFSHAVQIGNAIEEKKVLDLVLIASGQSVDGAPGPCLFSAITDCGAGGLSSAIGEMGAETGAEVDLERVPLKYAGLRYDEIWISEAQERMVLSVPPENVEALLSLARAESVEATVIGRFTDNKRLVVRYSGIVVGDLDMTLLHEGVPRDRRVAEWPAVVKDAKLTAPKGDAHAAMAPVEAARRLNGVLSQPTIASKHWIYRQYDHEVQSGSVVKPWTGPGEGPTDAAVIRPVLGSMRGVAIGCGIAPQLADVDPYWMAIAAIDEALRNVVCVGGDPRKTAILDNFCWPASDDPVALGALVRACQACYDGARRYGLPFISGKDSLNNVFAMSRQDAAMLLEVIREQYGETSPFVEAEMSRRPNKLSIPYTLLISALSIVDDVSRTIQPMPRFNAGADGEADEIVLHYVGTTVSDWNAIDPASPFRMHAALADAIAAGAIVAVHDVSDGGVATAVVEMAMARPCMTAYLLAKDGPASRPFAPAASAYVVQMRDASALASLAEIEGVAVIPVARLRPVASYGEERFLFVSADDSEAAGRKIDWAAAANSAAAVSDFRAAWRQPLDW
ncbi:MAG: phosphoribosylformylglycinamidine synthase subunit PurS [Phycisphaerae bacterium]|nr:phosphoribosylformylglycinamidine synthase subunit PurS [Phycisphaerae bacterium]